MKQVFSAIDRLVEYSRIRLGLDKRDALYARNSVLGVFELECYEDVESKPYAGESCAQLLRELVAAAKAAGLMQDGEEERICDSVMGGLMPLPSLVCRKWEEKLASSSKEATDWLYEFSVESDYVKKEKLDANPRYDASNGLIITINKSKPEFRDPKKAASGNATKGGYPKCSICRDNEGFYGRSKRTLRTVDINLGGESWFWQYSPYGYFYQHGIAVNSKHTPMHVDAETFERLMDFVDLFPHFFIGCNAALPLIGGSVLAHDHYPGGGEVLPLHRAKIAIALEDKEYPDCTVGVLDWPGTAIRIAGKNRKSVAAISEKIRAAWCNYNDETRGIIARDEKGMHSAVSPTVVKNANGYEMTLILRNNITTEQYPDGVFHAHPEFHVIKKESIGLIEAQGLFILPGRLEKEMGELEKLLVAGKELPAEMSDFALVFDEMKAMRKTFTAEEAAQATKDELASVCYRILQNTAVFKTVAETADFLKGAL